MKQKMRILDSQLLIKQWNRCKGRTNVPVMNVHAKAWALQLIEVYRSNAIVTLVAIEFLVGFTSRGELLKAEAFLSCFECIDLQHIPKEDWQDTFRLARRIPRVGKRRQLGDCLIRAIANRLRREVITGDAGFPG